MNRNKNIISITLIAILLCSSGIVTAQEKAKAPPEKIAETWTAYPNINFEKAVAWSIQEGKSTRLILKKVFESESVSKTSEFLVEQDQSRFKLSISGQCREGRIIIMVSRPSEKLFKQLIIDPSADVEWSQSVRFTKEDSDFTGQWIVMVKAEEANGSYHVMLSAD